MTQKVFWSDPYRTRDEATVTTVTGDEITLDATIFFAFSGGQESDQGTIGGFPVLSARKSGWRSILLNSGSYCAIVRGPGEPERWCRTLPAAETKHSANRDQ